MRAQASLEFLLILSVIAILAAATVAMYGKAVRANKEAIGSLALKQTGDGTSSNLVLDNPKVSIYLPLNSTLFDSGRFLVDAYGCANGSLSLSPYSKTVVFSGGEINARIRNVTMLSGVYEPVVPGLGKVLFNYSVSCQGRNFSSSDAIYTYSSAAGWTAGQDSAYISRKNEALSYTAFAQDALSLQESNHCTITDVWTGRPYTVTGQCGTGNSWDYMVFDGSCLAPYWAYSRTYCIVPQPTGYEIVSPGGNLTAYYNISLDIYFGTGTLQSNLSGGPGLYAVYLGGAVVGNASVAEVDVGGQASVAQISNGSASWPVGSSTYEAYQQARNSLYATLSFYNSSGLSGSTQSAVQEAIAEFDKASKALPAYGTGGGCSLHGDRYVCSASEPFSYVIDVSLAKGVGIANGTLYYDGSEIRIYVGAGT